MIDAPEWILPWRCMMLFSANCSYWPVVMALKSVPYVPLLAAQHWMSRMTLAPRAQLIERKFLRDLLADHRSSLRDGSRKEINKQLPQHLQNEG